MGSADGLRPDAIFVNGNVLTLDARSRRVEAVAALGGRIVAVGPREWTCG